ncbi:MAG TPA: S-methyl-5-thioribose-1-phosphate isomerase, partial [Roseiarcus sp.]|nr:S-methyl-5-thioribose-1-phosphate isomerase [Roseiarcus sp.]
EERDASDVTFMTGRLDTGEVARVAIAAPGSPALNPAFDVTPAELITGLITDRGVAPASREGLDGLFPERRAA